jgi:hypothetical protein
MFILLTQSSLFKQKIMNELIKDIYIIFFSNSAQKISQREEQKTNMKKKNLTNPVPVIRGTASARRKKARAVSSKRVVTSRREAILLRGESEAARKRYRRSGVPTHPIRLLC